MLNKAHRNGIFSMPIQTSYDQDFPIIQYANDTLLFMNGSQREFFALKAILNTSASTGLKVNFDKSCLIPINMDKEKASLLAGVFGCSIGKFRFTYLGLSLGTTCPKIEDHTLLMNNVERRLFAVSNFLTMARRLEMLPTYTMCSLKLPTGVIQSIDWARRQCLWRSSDINASKKSLVVWERVCRPKRNGGLGVINLQLQNEASLLKNLNKFYNKHDFPWVHLVWNSYYRENQLVPHVSSNKGSFWWRDILKFVDHFRGIAHCHIGKGDTVLLWNDLWDGALIKDMLPRLFSFATNENIIVVAFRQDTNI